PRSRKRRGALSHGRAGLRRGGQRPGRAALGPARRRHRQVLGHPLDCAGGRQPLGQPRSFALVSSRAAALALLIIAPLARAEAPPAAPTDCAVTDLMPAFWSFWDKAKGADAA